MFGGIVALIRKELLAILRDPRGRFVLIGPPLAQLLIFSFAATLEVRNADLAILNQDAGRWGVELVQRLEPSDTFDELLLVRSPNEIRALIDGRRVIGALEIGPTFSRDLEAGRPANVLAVLDGRRSNAAQIVAGYLSEITARLSAELGGRAPGEAVVATAWFNPNLEYTWYTVPSLIAIIALLVGLIVTALSVARERELGTFDQLLVSPLTAPAILIGKTVPPLIIGTAHATVYILVAVFLFGVPLAGSLPLLYLSLEVYLMAVIGVGLFISALAATQQQAILGAFLFMSPAILLSGFATPIENMPGWLQPVTYLNPLRYFLVIIKGSFLRGLPAAEIFAQMLPMAAIALVTLGTAAILFRKRLA